MWGQVTYHAGRRSLVINIGTFVRWSGSASSTFVLAGNMQWVPRPMHIQVGCVVVI